MVKIVNAPFRKGGSLKKYICHQTLLRSMIVNLAKMPYITEENRIIFFKQTKIILQQINLWYSETGFDLFMHLVYQLLNFLKGDACFIDNVRIMLSKYDQLHGIFFANKKYVELSINNCKKNIIVFPFLLTNTIGEHHANLLIMDIRNQLAWRVEPNAGTTFDQFDKNINGALLKFFKEIGFRFLYNFPGQCPLWLNRIPKSIVKYIPVNVQAPTEYLEHSGLCMFLAVGKFIYGKTLTNEILRDFIVRFFKNELKNICSI